MNKIWRIFRYEYLRHVLTRRFLFGLISMPLFIILLIGVGIVAVSLQTKKEPIGYIDQSDWLQNPLYPPDNGNFIIPSVKLIRYSDEAQARADVQNGTLQAVYIIARDYLQTGQVSMIVRDRPGENAQDKMREFLRLNLLASQPSDIRQRLLNGSSITVRSADGSRSVAGDNWLASAFPMMTGLIFIIVISISGGYLLQAVVEEKENRTMEIIITSVSPNQLMTGKIIANLLAGLTQLFVWFLFAMLGLLAVQYFFHLGSAPMVSLSQFGLLMAIMLPAFVMVAALMTAVGATVTESREAQQVSGLFILPMVAPYWFIPVIMSHPNSPLSVALSIFPLTAPVTLPMRVFFTVVPAWQIILTIFVLVATALGALWLAGKVFRMGMLRYGKRLSLREMFSGKPRKSEG